MGRHVVVVDAVDMNQAGYRVEDLLEKYAPSTEYELECILDLDTGNVRALQGNKIPEFMLSREKLNAECRKYIVSEEECKRIISDEIKKDVVDWSLVKQATLRAINYYPGLNPLTFDVCNGDELNAWEFNLFGVTLNDYEETPHLFAVCAYIVD